MAPTTSQRPPLPISRLNPLLAAIPEDNLVVKYQTIVREGVEIVVGRVKVPTPDGGHAFVLRRYDTQAFSLTTMFKACFPGSSDEEEKAETEWVTSEYDNTGANGGKGSKAIRLAGSWVMPETAMFVAQEYGIHGLIVALAEAEPNPAVAYRKSQRSQAAAENSTPTTHLRPPGTKEPASKRSRTAPSPTKEVTITLPAAPIEDSKLAEVSNQLEGAEAEIKKAKELVEKVKRDVAEQKAKKEEEEELGKTEAHERGVKRALIAAVEQSGEDGPEGVGEAMERAIATNARAERAQGGRMQVVRQTAWGALVFAVGVGATAVIPRFFF